MHAMIVESRPSSLDALQIAFLEAGIHVTGSGRLEVAACCLRRATVNLLLLDTLACGDRLTEIVTLAERRNPRLATLVLSDDVQHGTDRLAERIASLHAVLARDADPRMVARLARSSAEGALPARAAAAPASPPLFQSSRRSRAAGTGALLPA